VSIAIVDRHDQPGGHWNDAYPFVRLHSPSAYYGVNSRPLGEDQIDRTGLNEGLYELASAAEICGYFDRVMKGFLETGRVRYFPLCEYRGDGRFVSRVTARDAEWHVTIRRKLVDATYTDTAVPSTHPPRYAVASGVCCVPPNDLPRLFARPDHPPAAGFVVVGAGKTGIDAVLWLLQRGVAPDLIRWIVPRDPWLLDRLHLQPGSAFFEARVAAIARQLELVLEATSIDHLFRLLSEAGMLLRIDAEAQPEMFRCATVSRGELALLRRVTQRIRLGRVRRIDAGRIVLDRGDIETSLDHVHVDCTAAGIKRREALPVFTGATITLQSVRMCQPCFSAALIGHVEATGESEPEMNTICSPIPYATESIDWLRMNAANYANQYQWIKRPDVRDWIARSRLDPARDGPGELTRAREAILKRFRDNVGPATAKLYQLLANADGAEAAALSR
jgi:hypothetical protein